MYKLCYVKWDSAVFFVGYDLFALERRQLLSSQDSHEAPKNIETEIERLDTSSDPWLHSIVHPADGNAVEHIRLLGCIMPWSTNPPASKGSAFLETIYEEVHERTHTNGWDLDLKTMQVLQDNIQLACSAPALSAGREAFLSFEPCVPSQYFSGWKLRSLSLKPGRSEQDGAPESRFRNGSKLVTVGPDTIDCFEWDEEIVYDAEIEQKLLSLGQRLGCTKEDIASVLRVYLLWDNCD